MTDFKYRNEILLVTLIAAVFAFLWFNQFDVRVGKVNVQLQNDPELAAYPYTFRLIDIDQQGIANVSTPRSAKVSVLQFFAIVKPELAEKGSNSPKLIAAQKEISFLQEKAKQIVLAHPDIQQVHWQIDKHWYASKGVELYL